LTGGESIARRLPPLAGLASVGASWQAFTDDTAADLAHVIFVGGWLVSAAWFVRWLGGREGVLACMLRESMGRSLATLGVRSPVGCGGIG